MAIPQVSWSKTHSWLLHSTRVSASTAKAGKVKHSFSQLPMTVSGQWDMRTTGVDNSLEKLFALLVKGLGGSLTLLSYLRCAYDVWSYSSHFRGNIQEEKAKRIEKLLAVGLAGSRLRPNQQIPLYLMLCKEKSSYFLKLLCLILLFTAKTIPNPYTKKFYLFWLPLPKSRKGNKRRSNWYAKHGAG